MSTNKLVSFKDLYKQKRKHGEPGADEATYATAPENAPPLATQPANLAVQLPESATQTANPESAKEPEALVTQIPSQPNTQYVDSQFPSRILRRQKSIRLPVSKLPGYEDYQHANRHVFKDFQDLVEYALDWVTSQPVTQLPKPPNTQIPALIKNEVNNQLIINDEKAQRILARYARVTSRAVKQRDFEAYAEVAHLDESVLERGIDAAPQKAREAGHTINGFRYCLIPILEAARAAPPKPAAAAALCELCRPLNGWVYVDEAKTQVKKCDHRAGD